MGPSGNKQHGFKFMSLLSMKNITRTSWDIIPRRDIAIDWVNLLGKDKQELLVFTDFRGQIFGDGDSYITVVDEDGYEKETLLKIENENDLKYQDGPPLDPLDIE